MNNTFLFLKKLRLAGVCESLRLNGATTDSHTPYCHHPTKRLSPSVFAPLGHVMVHATVCAMQRGRVSMLSEGKCYPATKNVMHFHQESVTIMLEEITLNSHDADCVKYLLIETAVSPLPSPSSAIILPPFPTPPHSSQHKCTLLSTQQTDSMHQKVVHQLMFVEIRRVNSFAGKGARGGRKGGLELENAQRRLHAIVPRTAYRYRSGRHTCTFCSLYLGYQGIIKIQAACVQIFIFHFVLYRVFLPRPDRSFMTRQVLHDRTGPS